MIRAKEYNHVGMVVRDLEKCKIFYGEGAPTQLAGL